MGRFAPDNRVHTVTGKANEFILTKPLRYYSSKYDFWVTVPIGFPTDFASLPRPVRGLINRNGKSRPAAVIHDYLCVKQLVSRRGADQVFLEALKACDVNPIIRWTMYSTVRVYGRLKTTRIAIQNKIKKGTRT